MGKARRFTFVALALAAVSTAVVGTLLLAGSSDDPHDDRAMSRLTVGTAMETPVSQPDANLSPTEATPEHSLSLAPCSALPGQLLQSLVPADFMPRHRFSGRGTGSREDHELWVCNPEPGLYVELNATTGEVYGVAYADEEREVVADLLRQQYPGAFEVPATTAQLPAPGRHSCPLDWQTISFDGASICAPADWQQSLQKVFAFSTEPDRLILHPDGTVPTCGVTPCPSLTVGISAGPSTSYVGFRDCDRPQEITGNAGHALVCAEEFEESSVSYGFVFDSQRYVQISVATGTAGRAYLQDALTVVMNVFESSADAYAATPLEVLRNYIVDGHRLVDCGPLAETMTLGYCYNALGTPAGQRVYTVSDNGGYSYGGLFFIATESEGGHAFDHVEPPFCVGRKSIRCPMPIGATVEIDTNSSCANARLRPGIREQGVDCLSEGVLTTVGGPAIGRDGRVWMQLTGPVWVSASYVTCLLGCLPQRPLEAPESYILPGFRDWGDRRSLNPSQALP